MKKQICIIVLLLTCRICNAQNPLVKQWDKRFGGNIYDEVFAIKQTSSGGFLLGGDSNSGISGDKTQTCLGSNDYWVVLIDSVGNKIWDKRFGWTSYEYIFDLQQTSDNGFLIGGYTNSNIGGDVSEPPYGGTDYWVVKTDSLGNKLWDKRYGGSNLEFMFSNSVQQTLDGGYIIGGTSYSDSSGNKSQHSKGDRDFWIIKIDTIGNIQWDKDFGGSGADVLCSLQQTNDGGYILGGYSSSGISGDKTQPSWGSWDYWIVKTDSIGNKSWDKRYGGFNEDYFHSIQQTNDGGYILGGLTNSSIGGDKTQIHWGTNTTYDYWIVKTDSLGNKIWDKDFGGIGDEDVFGTVVQTYDKGYLVSGTSDSPISGDKTESNIGYEQTWIVKTDSLGNKIWDKTIFTLGHDETGYAIQTTDSCYAIAVSTNSQVGGYKTQPSRGSYDFWIVKFCDTTVTSSIQIIKDVNSVEVYPNPVKDKLNITVNNKEFSEIILYDITSRKVLQQEFTNSVSLNTERLEKGLYLYEVRNKDGSCKKGKIVKD